MSERNQIEDANTPAWLKTIQLNSWEAELLISALVLYALIQVPDYLSVFAYKNFDRGSLFLGLFRILIRSVELLSYGYILHILVRGVWVANVGLSYVFPKGVNAEKLAFKGKFGKEVENQGSLVKGVLRLEELSSLIYGVSFVLFGCLLGFGTSIMPFVALSEYVTDLAIAKSPLILWPALGTFFYFIMIIILLIDFLTNGLFRRIEWTAKIYYPIALVFRVLTLSFLYRRALLALVSNVSGWRSYLIPLIIFGASTGFFLLKNYIRDVEIQKYLKANQESIVSPSNYEDKRADGDFFITTIQSDVVYEGVLRIFLKDLKIFGTMQTIGVDLGNEKWDNLNSEQSSARLNEWLTITVDSTESYEPDWFISQHPTDGAFGFSSFIDISEIGRGQHTLKVALDTSSMDMRKKITIADSDYAKLTLSNIQFFFNKYE